MPSALAGTRLGGISCARKQTGNWRLCHCHTECGRQNTHNFVTLPHPEEGPGGRLRRSWIIGTPTKRQVSKLQVSKRLVSKCPVSKSQVYKTSGFTKRQVSKRLVTWRFVNLTFCKPAVADVLKLDVLKTDVLKPDVLKPDVLWVYRIIRP